MQQYLNLLNDVLNNGTWKQNRTGIETKYIPAAMIQHDMNKGFPLLTTKKMNLRNIATELEFFIKGESSKEWLKQKGCNIWNPWANPKKVPYANDEETKKKMLAEDDLGRIYGVQWRHWRTKEGEIDQLKNLIQTLLTNPLDRRMIVNAWNPGELDQMALPPCHFAFECISDGTYLDLNWYQRSSDLPVGVPYDLASYALLLELIAKTTKLIPRYITGFLSDVHIYEDQIELVRMQLERPPLSLPTLILADSLDIFNWYSEDHILYEYVSHPAIKYPVAV